MSGKFRKHEPQRQLPSLILLHATTTTHELSNEQQRDLYLSVLVEITVKSMTGRKQDSTV